MTAKSPRRVRARARVNGLVRTGKIPHPNELPCAVCGHRWRPGERRHEYDHERGYRRKDSRTVRALCTTCHRLKSQERRDDCSFCSVCNGPHRKHARRGVPGRSPARPSRPGRTPC